MSPQVEAFRARLAAEHRRRMEAAQAAQSTRPTLAGIVVNGFAWTAVLALVIAALPTLVVLAAHLPG